MNKHDTPNGNGSELEALITGVLSARFVEGEDFRQQYDTDRVDIFGYQTRVDWFVYHTREFPDGVYIEAKSQTSIGTADRKIPYLIQNIEHVYRRPTIVVLDGLYLAPALRWAQTQVDGVRLLGAFDFSGFRQYWKSQRAINQQMELFEV